MATYNCGNCREKLGDEAVKNMDIGQNRRLVFCKACNCYIKLEEPAPQKAPAPKPAE